MIYKLKCVLNRLLKLIILDTDVYSILGITTITDISQHAL